MGVIYPGQFVIGFVAFILFILIEFIFEMFDYKQPI